MFPRRTPIYALVLLMLGAFSIRADVSVVSRPFQPSTTASLDSSAPVMSGDGRYVLYLTANGGNGWINLYLRDLQAGITELISATPSGQPGSGNSAYATMSADARYVAFQSSAPDLVANDTNNVTDIFLRDRQTQTTIAVSAAADGTLGNGLSENATITANGQFVVFESAANNLGPTDADATRDIYVRDMQTGQITLASTGLTAIENVKCFDPSVSNDGNRIAFVCGGHVYLRDRAGATTTQISITSPGTANNRDPFVSADGAYVIFISSDFAGLKRYDVAAGTNYFQSNSGVGGFRATPDARFAFDGTNRIDFATHTVTPCIVDTTGATTKAFTSSPSISDDGNRVFFLSNATNLVDGVTDAQYRWYVRDLSANTNGVVGVASNLRLDFMSSSSDGSRVALDANSFGLAGDLNLGIDVFSFDSVAGLNLASARTNVAQPNAAGRSFLNGVSADGAQILFSSDAGNLVANDTNAVSDVFVFNVAAGTNRIVTLGAGGEAATDSSSRALFSGNARYVAFFSLATNLVDGDIDAAEDVFITDRESGETRLITTAAGVALRAFSDDGRFLLFERSISPVGVFLYDWQASGVSVIPGASSANAVNGSSVMSFDGAWFAYRNTLSASTSGGIWLYSYGDGSSTRIAPLAPTSGTVLSFAPQSHWLLYGSNSVLFAQDAISTDATPLQTNVIAAAASAQANYIATVAAAVGATPQVYIVERATGNIALVSQRGGAEGNGSSDSPQISLDGSRILFRSKASNLVENDTNGGADYFVYDRASSTTRRLAASSQGALQKVMLSPDGSYAAFQTLSDGVVAGDDNRSSDVFVETIPAVQADITAHIARSTGGLILSWNTVPGGKYRIESSPSLTQPSWAAFVPDRTAAIDHDEIAFDFAGQELYLRVLKLP